MKFYRKYKPVGWRFESHRHSLAAKGIRTRLAAKQKLVQPLDIFSDQTKINKLAVDLADGRITAEQLDKKVKSPEEYSLVLDKRNEILSTREYTKTLQEKAKAIARAPVTGKPKAAAVPGARKVVEEEKLREELAAEQRLPFQIWLRRAKEGDFTNPTPPDNDAEIIAQRAAVIQGVQAKIDRGDIMTRDDWEDLDKIYNLSHKELNQLKAYHRQELPTALQKVGRVAAKEALEAEEVASAKTGAWLKKGWGNLKERVVPSIDEISGGKIEDELKKIEAKKQEIEASEGVFNPMGISWMGEGGEESLKKERRNKTYAEAISLQRDLDALYQNKDKLAKADLNSYSKGEQAFKRGDREMLLDAITELDAQHMKLQDRMWSVEAVRSNFLRKDVMDQTIAMSNDNGGGSNFLFSSGGGDAIVKQSKKINEIKEAVKKSSNEVAGRLAMLRNKLKRMDATVPYQSPVPERPVKVFRGSGGLGLTSAAFDDFDGQLNHENPVLDGVKNKDIKNPALVRLEGLK